MTEAAYDMDTWEIREFPYADWLSREDQELLKGTMPSTFSGSICYNLVLRRLNRDNGMSILTPWDFLVMTPGKPFTKRSVKE